MMPTRSENRDIGLVIAAAPDLLEALIYADLQLRDHGQVDPKVRAAIAKARDENDKLRKAIRSFERAETELRRASLTAEQPRLQRAGNRYASARYRMFQAAKP